MNRHLPLTVFERLLPVIANTKLVFLQGWGEPFLNPDVFAMVALAKEAGCRVGTTTNGMLLDCRKLGRLVESGIDIISFSIAGLDDRNDTLRKGTRLQTVLDAIRRLQQEKENRECTKPAIHVSYLLLRSGLSDLAKLPDVLSGLGIDQVVISTLDFVPARELEGETLYACNAAEYEELTSFLDGVKAMAEVKGLHVHYNLGQLDKPREVCSENPQRSFYVSSDGMISPCVFTNLPITDASYRSLGKERPHEPLVFGNTCDYSASAIWRNKEYRAFRQSFDTGQLRLACRDCYKLRVA